MTEFSDEATPQEREPTPQGLVKRFPWSKPKVQMKPTRAQSKNFKNLIEEHNVRNA